MEHDHRSVAMTLLDAAALHIDPDDPGYGQRLIADHVARLVRRVRAVRIGIDVGLGLWALALFLLAWRNRMNDFLLGCFASGLIVWVVTSRGLVWNLIADPASPFHDRLAFLWPEEPKDLRAFMDKLASGELRAYYDA